MIGKKKVEVKPKRERICKKCEMKSSEISRLEEKVWDYETVINELCSMIKRISKSRK